MSTNHTPNYNLSQWEAADKVLRTDFNADNAKLDAALHGLSAGKADVSALNSLTQTVNALSQTSSSHSSTLARKGNCQIQPYSYRGDGATPKTIHFSNKPLLVLIFGGGVLITAFRDHGSGLCISPPTYNAPSLSWGALSVTLSDPNGTNPDTKYVIGNQKGYTYQVIALLDAES